MAFPSTIGPETLLEHFQFFGPKIFFAVVCGAVVGIEREIKNKAAGIKTNILICLGSAIFTGASVLISEIHSEAGVYADPGRMAAQIISGVGFIGAGAIMRAGGNVVGLTTAATIWVVSAIGVVVGMGEYMLGLFIAILVVVVLTSMSMFEHQIFGRSIQFSVEVVLGEVEGQMRAQIYKALEDNELTLDDYELSKREGVNVLTLKYTGPQANQKKFLLELWSMGGIKEVKQL